MSDNCVTPSSAEIADQQYPLLSRIGSPADLKALAESQLPALCEEIRTYLIKCLSVNPGHFGSSMGAVDIIVALHYVFDAPLDHIVFDVGHQAYAHKLLTGRFHEFERQRCKGGLSGFPFPPESEYDSFVCGHAGNSISAALGMAIADSSDPARNDRKTVALIGDASIGNGLAFEGLNNASQHPNNLLIVLNDNEMSIDDNVGALHRNLSNLLTSRRYNKLRLKIYDFLRRHGLIKDRGKGLVLRFNNSLKSLVAGQQNIFEGLNIRYFGPFNGNDVLKVVKVLRDIKDMQGPRILHLHTSKGKGFAEAEKNPAEWHAPGKFDSVTGKKIKKQSHGPNPLWQEVFGEQLLEMARADSRIVGITAAMPSGTSLNRLQELKGRMFDVGISEGHAVTFAGGLASAGKRPYVAVYSSFLQRGFDNIIHDVAVQGLPVVFCIDRAGLVGEDGVTHHGFFDIAYLRIIPGMKLAAPMDAESLKKIMKGSLDSEGPMAIRYPRGESQPDICTFSKNPAENQDASEHRDISIPGTSRVISKHPNSKIAVLSIGPSGYDVQKALQTLAPQGIYADHYDMVWVKPLDEKLLQDISGKYDGFVTVEDGISSGGFGSAVMEWFAANNLQKKIAKVAIPDQWIYQGTLPELKADTGLDAAGIAAKIKSLASDIALENE